MFGLQDPISLKWYRKDTALDVNDETFKEELEKEAQCKHEKQEHERIAGMIYWNGQSVARSAVVARWTPSFARHILKSAAVTIKPSTSCLLLLLPKRLTMNRASLRCAPLFSIDLDRMKPPSNSRISGLPYDWPTSSLERTPLI